MLRPPNKLNVRLIKCTIYVYASFESWAVAVCLRLSVGRSKTCVNAWTQKRIINFNFVCWATHNNACTLARSHHRTRALALKNRLTLDLLSGNCGVVCVCVYRIYMLCVHPTVDTFSKMCIARASCMYIFLSLGDLVAQTYYANVTSISAAPRDAPRM